jgi:hypothetical protein
MSNMQFDKTSGTTLSPLFGGRKPTGVYTQNPGSINCDPGSHSAGGEVRRSDIIERGGSLLKR